jgi:hypothetical protein
MLVLKGFSLAVRYLKRKQLHFTAGLADEQLGLLHAAPQHGSPAKQLRLQHDALQLGLQLNSWTCCTP